MFNNKKIKEQEMLIEGYRKERNEYMDKYNKAVLTLAQTQNDSRKLVEQNHMLVEENQKLIEWIKEIIAQAHKVQVKNPFEFVTIPVHEKVSSRMIDGFGKQTRKDITIPTIHFTEFSKFDDMYV